MIPTLQLGLYTMSRIEVKRIVPAALEAGYRGFDSAQMYGNEEATGRAINQFLGSERNKGGLVREDVFYTTKLAENSTDYATARNSISRSLTKCDLGYIDLLLLHSPYGGKRARLTTWKAAEDAVMAGQVRMIGVSNFGAAHVSGSVLVGCGV